MHTRRMVMAAALILLPWPATRAAANGGTERAWHRVKVTFVPTGGTFANVDTACDTTDPTFCGYLSKITAVVQTGDLVGTTLQVSAGVYTPGTGVFVQNSSGTFAGSIKRCGTGTVAYSGHDVFSPDGTSRGSVDLESDTGTGGLAGISGHFEPGPDGYSGWVRCRHNAAA